jgi:osmoprotectant transport system ATP-binding protein
MYTLKNLVKQFGDVTAVDIEAYSFQPGKTTVLLGQSGCGKSTLLRMLVGLIEPSSGEVLLDDSPIQRDQWPTIRRQTGYMIQDGGLFPHLTLRNNITIVARQLKMDVGEMGTRVNELADLVQVDRSLLDRFPREISGGQRQRMSLMRALFLDPQTLLLDEPLGALDPIIRSDLQAQLKTIFAELGKTVVIVTHDLGEAAYLADEVVLLNNGRIAQRGKLIDFVKNPAEQFVSEFVNAQRTELGWESA